MLNLVKYLFYRNRFHNTPEVWVKTGNIHLPICKAYLLDATLELFIEVILLQLILIPLYISSGNIIIAVLSLILIILVVSLGIHADSVLIDITEENETYCSFYRDTSLSKKFIPINPLTLNQNYTIVTGPEQIPEQVVDFVEAMEDKLGLSPGLENKSTAVQ